MEWRVNVRSDADTRLHGLWIFSSVATNATATGMYTISHFHRSQSRLWPSAFAVHSREVDKECSFIFLNCYFIAYNNSITCGGNVRQPLAHNKSSRTHTHPQHSFVYYVVILYYGPLQTLTIGTFFSPRHIFVPSLSRAHLCAAHVQRHHFDCSTITVFIHATLLWFIFKFVGRKEVGNKEIVISHPVWSIGPHIRAIVATDVNSNFHCHNFIGRNQSKTRNWKMNWGPISNIYVWVALRCCVRNRGTEHEIVNVQQIFKAICNEAKMTMTIPSAENDVRRLVWTFCIGERTRHERGKYAYVNLYLLVCGEWRWFIFVIRRWQLFAHRCILGKNITVNVAIYAHRAIFFPLLLFFWNQKPISMERSKKKQFPSKCKSL